jgi:hypothetical protein
LIVTQTPEQAHEELVRLRLSSSWNLEPIPSRWFRAGRSYLNDQTVYCTGAEQPAWHGQGEGVQCAY